jgi:hypothetical protein
MALVRVIRQLVLSLLSLVHDFVGIFTGYRLLGCCGVLSAQAV